MSEGTTARKKIFVSYSHKDEDWFKTLKERLEPLRRIHGIEIWDDKHLQPGDEWHAEIQKALSETKLALLLVSPNFINSEYVEKSELKPLHDARERGEPLTIAPLYVRSVDLDDIPAIAKLQGVNDPKKPLERLQDKRADLDDELITVMRWIKQKMQAPAASAAAASVVAASAAGAATAANAPSAAAAGAAAARSAPVAPAPAPVASRTIAPAAGADSRAGDVAADDDGDEPTIGEMISEQLQLMVETEGQQALALYTYDGESEQLLMMISEGADDNLICEIAANDEIDEALQLDERAVKELVKHAGFERPEIRGDRLWRDLGPVSELDPDELGDALAGLIEDVFGLPNEELALTYDIYDI